METTRFAQTCFETCCRKRILDTPSHPRLWPWLCCRPYKRWRNGEWVIVASKALALAMLQEKPEGLIQTPVVSHPRLWPWLCCR